MTVIYVHDPETAELIMWGYAGGSPRTRRAINYWRFVRGMAVTMVQEG